MIHEASADQIKAGQPQMSTWLSANAGSGKTRVLTDRVARLLLSGVPPERILCLTYTKAAAAEMQNRLFKRLGKWTMLDAVSLKAELTELGEPGPFSNADIARARTLFAQAIEATGGLKIQTIHSFCSSLLRRFPVEAHVSPQFKEIDETAQIGLWNDILQQIAEQPGPFDQIAELVDETKVDDLLSNIVNQSHLFQNKVNPKDLFSRVGLRPEYSKQDLIEDCVLRGDLDMLITLRQLMAGATTATDKKGAEKLGQLDLLSVTSETLAVLESLFLTAKGEISKRPTPTQKLRQSLPFLQQLESLEQRVYAARQNRLCLDAADRALALHAFAHEFLKKYSHTKAALGFLDFDDLIQKTKGLLEGQGIAAWVLYKLDGGIDHILVDEAQDTSPDQWDIIQLLTQEMTAGLGSRDDVDRTIFVVGDKKQSIYSFQGADPSGFDRMKGHFANRFEDMDKNFQSEELRYSFRSSKAILKFTDAVFNRPETGLLETPSHKAFKSEMPGRVDLWPSFQATQQPEPLPWTSPVDEVSPDHPDKRLADALAQQIKHMIEHEYLVIPSNDGTLERRKIQPSDFLILVRGRKARIFRELHRACKSAEIEIAGADRMTLTADLAVRDVLALLRFLATPEDSLALAEALKSPLFGWDEQKLFDLAHARSSDFLWRELERRATDFPVEHAILRGLRNIADFERPFELIQKILINHEGRKNLISRLGAEADEALDALVGQAIIYETSHVPNLTGFLVWIDASETEIKRQMDNAQNQVRIMTVHGSKGLEAPIVILPDTAKKTERLQSSVIDFDGSGFWMPKSDAVPDILARAKRNVLDREALENDRLLYVALTRAESWLIIAGSQADDPKSGNAWYTRLQETITSLDTKAISTKEGEVLRFETGDWSGDHVLSTEKPKSSVRTNPNVFGLVSDLAEDIPKPISPSDLGGLKALPTETVDTGFDPLEYGTAVHHLLEVLPALPKKNWHTVAADLDQEFRDQALAEAISVLDQPELAYLFDDSALAEVDLSAALPTLSDATIQGTVDRLLVQENRIFAIDFKSNQIVPDSPAETPSGLLRQMGAYAEALEQIFPDKDVETAILWTKTQSLMELPHHLVMAALQNTTSS